MNGEAKAFPAVLSNPTILPRVLRPFSMPHESLPQPNCATLMSIAVNPALHSQGAGKQLVLAFLEDAASRGLEAVNLKTDAKDNEKVNHFYIKMGFDLYRTFSTPEGRSMNEYIFHLDNFQS